MSTRGAYGFRVNGGDKIVFNHFDSYPSGLGAVIVRELVGYHRCGVAGALKLDAEITEVTIESKARCGATEGTVTPLRTLIANTLQDAHDFLLDSLFCEWAYIVNVDENLFEVYRGFQRLPHDKGRYAWLRDEERALRGYFPVALVHTFPLDEIANWATTWEDTVEVIVDAWETAPNVVVTDKANAFDANGRRRWLVRINGRRLWGWVYAHDEKEARVALRSECLRRGIRLTLGEPSNGFSR